MLHSLFRNGPSSTLCLSITSALLSSASGSSGPVGRYNLLPSYPLFFHTLAHSFAISCIFLHLRNQQLFSFHGITHSSTKKNRGWGPAAWSPKKTRRFTFQTLSLH